MRLNRFQIGTSDIRHIRVNAIMAQSPIFTFSRYVTSGFFYGAIRKTIDMNLNDPVVTVHHDLVDEDGLGRRWKSTNRPLLYAEKALVIGAHSCVSMSFSPYYVMKDLARLEAYARDIIISPFSSKSSDDDQRVGLFDHILS